MTGYHVALFFHLLALLSAVAASTIVHMTRVMARDAATGGAALTWLGLAHSFARVFPPALAVLVGTGAWMTHDTWTWTAPFILAGIAGGAFLLVSGAAIEGPRAARLAMRLADAPAEPVPDSVTDPVWWCASWANTGVAIGVVLAMVAKPGAGGAALCVAGGLCVGAGVGAAFRRRPARTVTSAAA